MKIAPVRATPLNLPVSVGSGAKSKSAALSLCLVDVELDDGRIGTGMTAIIKEEIIAAIVDDIASHALVGMDPLRHEQIWDQLYWLLSPRGQSGYASHAIAAIDLALWDLKGQILGPAGACSVAHERRCRCTRPSASPSSTATSSPRRRGARSNAASGGSR